MERVFRHFQDDLDALKERLLAMGGLAEERVRESVRGIMERDHTALDSVLSGDEPINDLHMEVDDRCFKLLALHQPMAADLRVIVAGSRSTRPCTACCTRSSASPPIVSRRCFNRSSSSAK